MRGDGRRTDRTQQRLRRDWRSHAIQSLALLLLLTWSAVAQVHAGQLHVAGEISLAGSGNWDYLTLDAQSRRLYVTLEGEIIIVDLDGRQPVGRVHVGGFVHGVALDPDKGVGYASDGEWPDEAKSPDEVAVFDLSTLKVLHRIHVGSNPDCILFDPASNRIFAFNHGASRSVSVIDPATNRVERTIRLDGPPEFAVTDGAGFIYVNIEEPARVDRIDVRTMTVTGHWPLDPCTQPSALALDRANRRLFSACFNRRMAVLDADTGKIVSLPEIGDGPDAVVYDEKTRRVFSANYDGTLTILEQLSPDRYRGAQVLTTRPDARTMALDPRTGTIFLSIADVGKLAPGKEIPPVIPNTFRLLVIEPVR